MLSANYCITAGMSIFFLVGCLLHLYENDIFTVKITNKFKRLIYVIIIETILDTTFALLEGKNVAHFMLYSLKSIELFVTPIIAFLVFDIFYNEKPGKRNNVMKKLRSIMLLTILFDGVLQITGLFGKQIFYIDENNLYHRSNLMVVYVLTLVLIILILMFELYMFSSKTQSTMKATLLVFIFTLNIGVVLRGIFPHNNYDFLCMSVSIPFLLIYYSHVTLRTDPLIHLLNRQVYSRLIEKINYTTIVIMIDANNFKQINDTYGHEYGDRALKELAHTICKAYGKYAYCFRLGGDEFCAILKPNAFDELVDETPYCDVYSMAEKFMERLDELILIQTENGKNSYLKCGASQGYGIFYSKTTHPNAEETIPLKEVIEIADKRMYHNKSLFREADTEAMEPQEDNSRRAHVLYEPSVIEITDKA